MKREKIKDTVLESEGNTIRLQREKIEAKRENTQKYTHQLYTAVDAERRRDSDATDVSDKYLY